MPASTPPKADYQSALLIIRLFGGAKSSIVRKDRGSARVVLIVMTLFSDKSFCSNSFSPLLYITYVWCKFILMFFMTITSLDVGEQGGDAMTRGVHSALQPLVDTSGSKVRRVQSVDHSRHLGLGVKGLWMWV
jgi:hypothetical protein